MFKVSYDQGFLDQENQPHNNNNSTIISNTIISNINNSTNKATKAGKGLTPFALIALYNRLCTNLPRVTSLREERVAAAAAALRDHPDIGFWEGVFRKTNDNAFLSGRRGRWRASFDWLVSWDKERDKLNAEKVFEGFYDDRPSGRRLGKTVSLGDVVQKLMGGKDAGIT
jgi:hypothetical protein